MQPQTRYKTVMAKKPTEPDPANPNSRPNIERFSMSVPRGMGKLIRQLCEESDLAFSQVFRRAMDEYVRSYGHRHSRELVQKWEEYRKFFKSEW